MHNAFEAFSSIFQAEEKDDKRKFDWLLFVQHKLREITYYFNIVVRTMKAFNTTHNITEIANLDLTNFIA